MRNFLPTTTGETHVLTSAADVTESQKSEALSWPIWDSTEDFRAQKQPKFVLRYRLEERVLILSGSAKLSPANGDPPFVVSAGDACTFRAGFVASWVVTTPMRKHYHYFDAAGEMCAEPSKTTPVIACDAEGCGKECVDESYSVEAEDICPKCLKKARGPEKKRFEAARRCKLGVAAPEAGATQQPTATTAKKRKAPPAAAASPSKTKTQ